MIRSFNFTDIKTLAFNSMINRIFYVEPSRIDTYYIGIYVVL